MSKFYVGQRVVCVRAPGFLVKGKVYTVLAKMDCSCGQSYVGHTPSPGVVLNDRFPCCGKPTTTKDCRWAKESCFAPITEHRATVDAECLTAYDVVPETIAPVEKEVGV